MSNGLNAFQQVAPTMQQPNQVAPTMQQAPYNMGMNNQPMSTASSQAYIPNQFGTCFDYGASSGAFASARMSSQPNIVDVVTDAIKSLSDQLNSTLQLTFTEYNRRTNSYINAELAKKDAILTHLTNDLALANERVARCERDLTEVREKNEILEQKLIKIDRGLTTVANEIDRDLSNIKDRISINFRASDFPPPETQHYDDDGRGTVPANYMKGQFAATRGRPNRQLQNPDKFPLREEWEPAMVCRFTKCLSKPNKENPQRHDEHMRSFRHNVPKCEAFERGECPNMAMDCAYDHGYCTYGKDQFGNKRGDPCMCPEEYRNRNKRVFHFTGKNNDEQRSTQQIDQKTELEKMKAELAKQFQDEVEKIKAQVQLEKDERNGKELKRKGQASKEAFIERAKQVIDTGDWANENPYGPLAADDSEQVPLERRRDKGNKFVEIVAPAPGRRRSNATDDDQSEQ